MRHQLKKILYTIVWTSSSVLYSLSPYYGIRSQGVNDARELSGWENFINLDNGCNAYGAFSGTVEYSRSFRPRNIAQCMFGADVVNDVCTCDPAIVISGSQSANRGATDWLADYFGLPTDFKSTVGFRPLIQNFILDLDMYIGLDNLVEGLYFRIDAPITWTKWSMQMRETVQTPGVNLYPNGYFSAFNAGGSNQASSQSLVNNFTAFAAGSAVPTFTPYIVSTGGLDPSAAIAFPQSVFDPLAFARINLTSLECASVAEVRCALGWNWANEYSHVGFNFRFAAPTGNAPTGVFAFEPIVGNGKHWELGAGFSAHYDLFVSCDEVNRCGLYVDANVTHLFSALQRRTFDLKNKPNSRYMLAQKLGSASVPPVPASPTFGGFTFPTLANPPFPAVQFQSEFSPVANLTTFDVNVQMPVQADIVVMLNATYGRWSFDAGYNYWFLSCEQITPSKCNTTLLDDGKTWALKGDASVIGFEDDSAQAPLSMFTPIRLAATESAATIHSGTNFPASGTTDAATILAARANPNIDSPVLATDSNGDNVVVNPAAQGALNPQTRSSVPPVFLSLADVDLTGIKGQSNKFFTHLSYTWLDRENWVPYLGLGGEVEFGNNGNGNNCNTNCPTTSTVSTSDNCGTTCSTNSCVNCAVSQWGLWVKGGVAFN